MQSLLAVQSLKEFSQLKVGDFFDEKRGPDLLTIRPDTTIARCLDIMREHKILSVPCVDDENKIIGVVDIYEIVAYTAFRASDAESISDIDWSIPASSLIATTGNLVDDEVKGYYEAQSGDSICKLIEFLCKGAYRFIVHFPDGRRTVFSQRDLLTIFRKKFNLFVDNPSQLICDLGLGHAPVYSLKQTEITIQGLRKIRIKEVHAIAVVHEDTGKLVGCLSESDLREISSDTLITLMDPLKDFLNLSANRNNVFIVLDDHTFEFVVDMMIAKRLHRVYVVTPDYKPSKVITLTDVLTYFWNKLFDIFYQPEDI